MGHDVAGGVANSIRSHPTRSTRLSFKPDSSSSSVLQDDFVLRRTRKTSSSPCCSEWDWNKWTQFFAEVEHIENLASILMFQLEEAIEREDSLEAAKLKRAIAQALAKDTVAQIMSRVKNAVEDERSNAASTSSRHSGNGLVGWWLGCSKDSDDPFGRLVHITTEVGRFIGRSYTPRQLVTSSSGTPLFEIYVVKDANDCYIMQAMCMQQAKKSSANSQRLQPKDTNPESVPDTTLNERKRERSKETSLDIEEVADEGVRMSSTSSKIKFLIQKLQS